MGKRGTSNRNNNSDDEMGIEKKAQKPKAKIRSKKIKKMGEGKAARRGQPTKEMLDERKEQDTKKREAIRLRIKNKNKIKHNPSLLKDFNERFETESKRILGTKKHSHGQKKRLKRKVSFSIFLTII
jgi:hypothetical protein